MSDEKKPMTVFVNGEIRLWHGTEEELYARYDDARVVKADRKSSEAPMSPAGSGEPPKFENVKSVKSEDGN